MGHVVVNIPYMDHMGMIQNQKTGYLEDMTCRLFLFFKGVFAWGSTFVFGLVYKHRCCFPIIHVFWSNVRPWYVFFPWIPPKKNEDHFELYPNGFKKNTTKKQAPNTLEQMEGVGPLVFAHVLWLGKLNTLELKAMAHPCPSYLFHGNHGQEWIWRNIQIYISVMGMKLFHTLRDTWWECGKHDL